VFPLADASNLRENPSMIDKSQKYTQRLQQFHTFSMCFMVVFHVFPCLFFPESACEGFFVKKQPLYYIFTPSHLLIYIFTPSLLEI
jgi:hypothetical protein